MSRRTGTASLLGAALVMTAACQGDGPSGPVAAVRATTPAVAVSPSPSPSPSSALDAVGQHRLEPGQRVLLRRSGTGSATFPLGAESGVSLELEYACLGRGRIEVLFLGSGSGGPCQTGQGTTNVLDRSLFRRARPAAPLQVRVLPGTRWSVRLLADDRASVEDRRVVQ